MFASLKSRILINQGKYQQALAVLKKHAPADISQAPDYFNLMAVTFETLNKLDKAGAIYQQLVYVDPNKSAYWLGLGLALEHQNQLNQAINAYARVIDSYDATPAARPQMRRMLRFRRR